MDVATAPPLTWLRRAEAGVAAAVLAALVMGLPTDVVPNGWFTRMTPVRPLDVVLLTLTSLLMGALASTYVGRAATGTAQATGGGLLTVLAIGCPVCNKLVVLLLGISGATTWFAPAQPFLGLIAVGLTAWALALRLRPRTACDRP